MRKNTAGRHHQYVQRFERDEKNNLILDKKGTKIPIGNKQKVIKANKQHIKY